MHARAGVLIVLVLICAAGIWLGRPHPTLRALVAANFGFTRPIQLNFVIGVLMLLQAADLLAVNRRMKPAYSFESYWRMSPDYPFQDTLVEALNQAGFFRPNGVPPRVCVPEELLPQNYAMLYHYSTFDAYTSLFLRRPWEYLHARLGLTPPESFNTSISAEVYLKGPFPYPELAIVAGVPQLRPSLYMGTNEAGENILIGPARIAPTGTLEMFTNPAPRAFLVHAVDDSLDYGVILKKLATGYDIHRAALLDYPVAETLPKEPTLPGAAVAIRRFEPNSIWLEVDAKEKALLVLAEAWYPGWKAEIDGRISEMIPANICMRAVPVPAGRHQVRVFFRQNYFLAGGTISILSLAALLFVLIRARDE